MSDRLAPKPVARRDFLGLAGLWAAGLAIFGSLLGMARLAKPSVLPEASKQFRIGRPEDFAVDGAKIIAERNVHLTTLCRVHRDHPSPQQRVRYATQAHA